MLFLTLNTFSTIGGIEKVCRSASRVFDDIAHQDNSHFAVYSLHDKTGASTRPYLNESELKPFNGRRVQFVLQSIRKGISEKLVVLSHIHLSSVGLWIKRLSPRTKVVLLAHGIEVWKPASEVQKKFLQKCDLIIAVSEFTRKRLLSDYSVKNVQVINNCVDPFLPEPLMRRSEIRDKIGFKPDDFIILTVSRLTAKEVNKNYDKVLVSMHDLKQQIPNLRYLFVGKYEEEEKQRLERKVAELGLQHNVVFIGYISDRELSSYYNASDLYVMPSKKEGFGITFIEAMYFGLPVIGGNRDGSVDALLNGKLGILVDPERQDEITSAIARIYVNHKSFVPERKLILDHFGFEAYEDKWKNVLQKLM